MIMFLQDAVPPSRREYITVDEGNPAAYGPDGLLRDGYKIRIPITMMDASLPLQRMGAVPLNIVTGLRLDKEFYPDGSRRPAPTPRTPVVDVDPFIGNKPGFRDAAAVRANTDAGQAAKDSAYSEMCRDLQDAWKPDHLRAADARRTTADAVRPLGVTNAEWARAEGIRQMCDAWRSQDAPAAQILPLGAVPKHIGTVKAGDACTLDGAPGVYVDGGDGNLYCRTRPMHSTRSGTSSGDAVPRIMDAATAQKIKDAAYNEMVTDISNAWRT
jgi:hypothetical protein